MVVGVFKAGLQSVVVYVSHGKLRPDARNSHGLELKISHGSGSVLSESLVYFQGDFTAHGHLSADEMLLYYFLRDS